MLIFIMRGVFIFITYKSPGLGYEWLCAKSRFVKTRRSSPFRVRRGRRRFGAERVRCSVIGKQTRGNLCAVFSSRRTGGWTDRWISLSFNGTWRVNGFITVTNVLNGSSFIRSQEHDEHEEERKLCVPSGKITLLASAKSQTASGACARVAVVVAR